MAPVRGTFVCPDGSVISRLRINNGERDCFSGADEQQYQSNSDDDDVKGEEEDPNNIGVEEESAGGDDDSNGEDNNIKADITIISGIFSPTQTARQREELTIKILPKIACENLRTGITAGQFEFLFVEANNTLMISNRQFSAILGLDQLSHLTSSGGDSVRVVASESGPGGQGGRDCPEEIGWGEITSSVLLSAILGAGVVNEVAMFRQQTEPITTYGPKRISTIWNRYGQSIIKFFLFRGRDNRKLAEKEEEEDKKKKQKEKENEDEIKKKIKTEPTENINIKTEEEKDGEGGDKGGDIIKKENVEEEDDKTKVVTVLVHHDNGGGDGERNMDKIETETVKEEK